MTIARSVADVLRNHVVLEYEAIDRMYLNVYVPTLQTVGGMLGYLRVHRGQRFASTTAVAPRTEAFVRNIEQFVMSEGVDLITLRSASARTTSRRGTCGSSRRTKACCMSARRRKKRASCGRSVAAVSARARPIPGSYNRQGWSTITISTAWTRTS